MILFITVESCPLDWAEIDDVCYKGFNDQMLSFDKSLDQCKTFGGILAKIDKQSKTQLIVPFLSIKNEYWIGLRNYYDQPYLEKFKWIVDNSSSTSFQNWGVGDPPDSEHQCVVLSHIHQPGYWRWHHRLCDEDYYRICQVKRVILLGK